MPELSKTTIIVVILGLLLLAFAGITIYAGFDAVCPSIGGERCCLCFGSPIFAAIECSYYRCVEGCGSPKISQLKTKDFNCVDFCDPTWQDSEGKICDKNAAEHPVEVTSKGEKIVKSDFRIFNCMFQKDNIYLDIPFLVRAQTTPYSNILVVNSNQLEGFESETCAITPLQHAGIVPPFGEGDGTIKNFKLNPGKAYISTEIIELAGLPFVPAVRATYLWDSRTGPRPTCDITKIDGEIIEISVIEDHLSCSSSGMFVEYEDTNTPCMRPSVKFRFNSIPNECLSNVAVELRAHDPTYRPRPSPCIEQGLPCTPSGVPCCDIGTDDYECRGGVCLLFGPLPPTDISYNSCPKYENMCGVSFTPEPNSCLLPNRPCTPSGMPCCDTDIYDYMCPIAGGVCLNTFTTPTTPSLTYENYYVGCLNSDIKRGTEYTREILFSRMGCLESTKIDRQLTVDLTIVGPLTSPQTERKIIDSCDYGPFVLGTKTC